MKLDERIPRAETYYLNLACTDVYVIREFGTPTFYHFLIVDNNATQLNTFSFGANIHDLEMIAEMFERLLNEIKGIRNKK